MSKPSAIQVLLAKRLNLPATASKAEVCRAALAKMAAFGLRRFSSKEELIEAKAQEMHRANLESGGVYDPDTKKRISDLRTERQAASAKVEYVTPAYAPAYGTPSGSHAWVIKGFGYAPS